MYNINPIDDKTCDINCPQYGIDFKVYGMSVIYNRRKPPHCKLRGHKLKIKKPCKGEWIKVYRDKECVKAKKQKGIIDNWVNGKIVVSL